VGTFSNPRAARRRRPPIDEVQSRPRPCSSRQSCAPHGGPRPAAARRDGLDRWETDREVQDSLVTVEFHERGGSTEVILRHEGFLTAAKRDRHNEGWGACLDKLATVV